MSWKEKYYIGDWSFSWERRFHGRDVLKLFSDVSVNSFAKFAVRRSKRVIHRNEAGKIIHEGNLNRLCDEEFMPFGRGGFWVDYQLRHGRYRATSEPDDWFNFQVSGPNAFTWWKRPRDKVSAISPSCTPEKSAVRATRLSPYDRDGRRSRVRAAKTIRIRAPRV